MKTTFRSLTRFSSVAEAYLKYISPRDPNGNPVGRPVETKLTWAIQRVQSKYAKLFETKIQPRLAKNDIEHCMEGDKKEILRDAAGQLKFTKATWNAKVEGADKIVDEEVDFEPYFADTIPDDLSLQELEEFSGFVIHPAKVEEILAGKEKDFGSIFTEPATEASEAAEAPPN